MAEWVHVVIDSIALISSLIALLVSWANRKGEAHKAALVSMEQRLAGADQHLSGQVTEIFNRLRGVEGDTRTMQETLRHQPTVEHIEGVRAAITQLGSQLQTRMGEVTGEMRRTTHQVDMIFSGLLNRESPR